MATPNLVAGIAADVKALSDLPREALVELWEQRFGCSPPRSCGRQLLELAAAYTIQEKAFGQLSPSVKRALHPSEKRRKARSEWVGRGDPKSPRALGLARAIKPGTRLVREWNGITHHVEAVEGGFVWNGKRRRTLSAIATEITGTRWSGPRFFGL